MSRDVKKYRLNKKGKAVVAILVIAVIFLVIKIISNQDNRTVDISNYIKVTYTGLQSRGKPNCQVDSDKLYLQLAGDEKNTEVLSRLKAVINSITIDSNKTNLKNGDSFTITVSYDKESAKKVGCKFKNLKYNERVSGLGEGKTIDIFQNVEVIIAGISPEAYANVSNKWTDDYLKDVSFSIENPSNITKGDVVVIKCDASEDEMMEHGYILQSDTKEFKVDKVNSYISDVSQIDMKLLNEIVSEAAQTIKSETESLKFRMFYKATNDSSYLYQYNTEWANSTELVSAVYLSKKENAEVNTNNYIYLLFKANISNSSTTSDIYFAFEYPDGILTSDSNCTIVHDHEESRYICGLNYDDIYSKVIRSKEDSYQINPINGLNKNE